MSGIYTITNILTNQVLVGESKNVHKRLIEHRSKLRGNYHENDYLQKAFNKYGEQNFKFELLENCDPSFLLSQENYWCNLLDSHNDRFGYNILQTGPNKISHKRVKSLNEVQIETLRRSSTGRKFTNEAKLKMSSAKKLYYTNHKHPLLGRSMTEETKQKISSSLKGKNFHTEEGIINISNSAKHRIKSVEEINKIINFHTGRKRSNSSIQNMINNSRSIKSVIQYDMNGSFIREWDRIREAAEFLKCDPSGISACCRNKCKSIKNFKWKYKQK